MLKMLQDTGGDDKQAALKLYEALVMTKNNSFNSEIQAHKAAVTAKDQNLSFTKLINAAKTEYKSMLIRNTWQDKNCPLPASATLTTLLPSRQNLKRETRSSSLIITLLHSPHLQGTATNHA
eukprot:1524080-Ditylum_brightwellii.AAC.1